MEKNEILNALLVTKGSAAKLVIKNQAERFERLTLSSDAYPDDGIDLIVRVLSNDEFFNKKCIDYFFVRIFSEVYLLSERQKKEILEAICLNYSRYSRKDVCWVIGDFIARTFEVPVVMEVFGDLFDGATAEGREGIVLGFDILARRMKMDDAFLKKVRDIVGR